MTPEMVRAGATVDNLGLMEPFKMDETAKTTLQPPRMENGRAFLVAGLGERVAFDNLAALPGLWQRFGEHLGHVPGQVGGVAYGVCYNTDDTGFRLYRRRRSRGFRLAAEGIRSAAGGGTALCRVHATPNMFHGARHVHGDFQ